MFELPQLEWRCLVTDERDDFGWLVTLLEEQKRNKRTPPSRTYSPQDPASKEFQQWRRRERRKYLMLALYAALLALSIILPMILRL